MGESDINPSFVSRILRLAYLSPTVVETILDGKYPAHLTMKDLMEPFPMDWERQAEHFSVAATQFKAAERGLAAD